MNIIWILFTLAASVSDAIRDLYIKKKIHTDPLLVVASTRIIAFVFLLILFPFFYTKQPFNGNIPLFLFLLAVTVVLTFVATTLKIRIIQTEEISLSSPLLSMSPIFIIPWAMLLLHETISLRAAAGIVFSVIGVLIILGIKIENIRNIKRSYLFHIFIILMIYGLTTVIDKIEIGMMGGFMYTLIWTGSSAAAGAIVLRKHRFSEYFKFTVSKYNIIQSVAWAVSFLFQQLAVQYSYDIHMNTAYIKSIMYLSILIKIIGGGKLFAEKDLLRKCIGTLLLIIGNIIILFMR